jgi:fused signal recognition particle receptor
VSSEDKKRKGLFGRLFGGKDDVASPPTATSERPQVEVEPAPEDVSTDLPAETFGSIVAANAEGDEAAVLTPSAEAREMSAPVVDPVVSKPTEADASKAPSKDQPKVGWFQKLKAGLGKTSAKLSDGISGLFTKRRLDVSTLDDLEDLLIQSDIGIAMAGRITSAISKGRFDKGITADDVRSILSSEVERVLQPVAKPLEIDTARKPHVVMMVGVNGTGKTTTIGKLAAKLKREGKSVVLAAGDTFRAAAIDQLKVWGERTGCPVVARSVGSDSAGLAFDALKEAQAAGADVLLLDTAGRLQNKQALMEELEKVVRVLKKLDSTAPHDVVLVLDATTGQNALGQVEVFRDRAGVTGLVMTKLDGTARGGILVAIAEKFGLPVHAVGVGEGVDDLQSFEARDFARAIANS